MEFAANGVDEISLTWNTIDLSRPIRWSSSEMDLVWRGDGLAALARHCGARVLDAQVALDPNGIAITLESGELRIFNALDEVGVSAAPVEG
ncbi:MAG: hypothetical protein IPK07_33610, partial [Deltaproteobacteria bacterium]|nr:hypothetical protein [Deltaproteobacteria bacterium]